MREQVLGVTKVKEKFL